MIHREERSDERQRGTQSKRASFAYLRFDCTRLSARSAHIVPVFFGSAKKTLCKIKAVRLTRDGLLIVY